MALSIGVPAEIVAGERRVALVPEVVGRLVKAGHEVRVQSGAGRLAFIPDEAYTAQGARISDVEEVYAASVIAKVQPPLPGEIERLGRGAVLVGFLSPLDRPEVAGALAARGVTALSMELVPRISRAQKMDALSAMSSVAGYKAALIAADRLPKFFPLLTTAAGTVRPANVLILGAGVAGLQAIATAKRLGARVSAYDVRPAVREEIQSLGGTFVDLAMDTAAAQDAGGYAKAMAQDEQMRQAELLARHIASADAVIATALVPGRRAPLLITRAAVEAMAAGSVIVDLAAPNGGNCEVTRPGDVVVHGGVEIHGPLNLASDMPVHASQMYARTVAALLQEFLTPEGFKTDFSDEVFRGACVTHGGEVVHERVKALLTTA